MVYSKCDKCYYNFDGVCAWHCDGEIDTYGQKAGNEMCLKYCSGYRINFDDYVQSLSRKKGGPPAAGWTSAC